MTTRIVTEIGRNGNPVGERIALARYTVPAGQRVLYGQRVQRRRPFSAEGKCRPRRAARPERGRRQSLSWDTGRARTP